MKIVDINAAKTDPASLVAEAEAGEEIKNDFRKSFGMLKGQIHITDDFDAPLPPELLKAFGIDE